MSHKRKNYLEWQEYFMSIAFLSAQRSKDPSSQVGACIVNKDKKIVGIGYNGMPVGCSDDSMPWNKAADDSLENWLQSKLPYVCHAELNAVLNKNSADLKGCIIYVALFPCNMCAQIIIQSGISEVVYYADKQPLLPQTKAAKHLLDMAGIPYRQFRPKQSQVVIDFQLIEETAAIEPTLPANRRLSDADYATRSQDINRFSCDEALAENLYNTFSESRSLKRSDYLEWEEYFMSMAFLSAQRSKDPRTQVGACIVNSEKKIVGIGYNGMPIGCKDDLMPWNRAADNSDSSWLDSKSPYVCHAELNAVLNKNTADIKGCTIYVALFPCNTCAQVCVQAGIKEVVYYSDKYHSRPEFTASRHMLSTAGVKYRQFRPRQQQILIDFEVHGVQERNGNNNSTVNRESGKDRNGDSAGQESLPTATNNNNKGSKESPEEFSNQIGILYEEEPNIVDDVVWNGQISPSIAEHRWMDVFHEYKSLLTMFIIATIAVLLSWCLGEYGS